MNNRPEELNNYLTSQSELNDIAIANALAQLETETNWKTLKPTVSTICKITSLSRNTVRNRSWALERLNSIKKKRKLPPAVIATFKLDSANECEKLPDRLRERIKSLLNQNALLFEEILSLQKIIRTKDSIIETLKRKQKF